MSAIFVETVLDDGTRVVTSPMKFRASVKAQLVYTGVKSFVERFQPDVIQGDERCICNWNRAHGNPLVYEDDLDRNYNLLTEVLISIREALQDGIPHLKDFQAGLLLCSLMHNWHLQKYRVRGGKRQIRDWAGQEATRIRSMLSHLHQLCRKSGSSRNEKTKVLKTLYGQFRKDIQDVQEILDDDTVGVQATEALVVDLDDEPIISAVVDVTQIKDEDDGDALTSTVAQAMLAPGVSSASDPINQQTDILEDSQMDQHAPVEDQPAPSAEPLEAEKMQPFRTVDCDDTQPILNSDIGEHVEKKDPPPPAGHGLAHLDDAAMLLKYGHFPETQPSGDDGDADEMPNPEAVPCPAGGVAAEPGPGGNTEEDPPSPSPPAVASADPTLEPGHVAVPAEVEALDLPELPDDLVGQQAELRRENKEDEEDKLVEKVTRKRTKAAGGDPVPKPAPKRARSSKQPREVDTGDDTGNGAERGRPRARRSEPAPEPKAKAKPKPRAKAEAKKEPKPKASPKKRPSKSASGSKKAPQEAKQDAKEKRRERALKAYDVLRDEDLPGLVLPELGQRISFTAFDPAKQGSSVGAVLYSESFYIAKPIHFSKWPDSCGNMSVNGEAGKGVTIPWGSDIPTAWAHAKALAGWQ